MPEGDSVHRLAAALREELRGHALAGLWLRERGWVGDLAGHTVCEVTALGQHLLVGIGPAVDSQPQEVLHVHLGLHGRFAHEPHGAPGERSVAGAAVQLDLAGSSYVCLRPARAELLRPGDLARHPVLSRLGPDLLAARFDTSRVVPRARVREARSAAELLLDQTVACGLGPVSRNEVLFLEGVHPRKRVSSLSDAAIASLYRSARRLLRRKLASGKGLLLHGCLGRPCPRCKAPLRGERLRDEARATFWCSRCQPEPRTRTREGRAGRRRRGGARYSKSLRYSP